MKFFESKSTQYVGIDIGSGGVKIVELRAAGGRPYLYTYAFSDDPVLFRTTTADDERTKMVADVAAVVKAVGSAAKTSSRVAVASLPQRDVFSTIVTIPKVDAKQFGSAVAHEVEKLLPFPLAEAVLDTRKLSSLPSEADAYQKIDRIFVTAARRKTIQLYSEIIQKAGYTLQTIETETFATMRALLGNDPSPVLIIDIGKIFTSVSYIERTVPHIDTLIELGGDNVTAALARAWNKPLDEVENLKIDLFDELGETDDQTLGEILEPVYQPLIKKIEEVFQIARTISAGTIARPDKIVLTGGASSCPMLVKKIESHFSIKTYRGDAWSRVIAPAGLKPVLDRIAPRFAVAIGLAERLIVS